MGEVNPEFIQPKEFRPNPTSSIEAKEIPVIDLSSAINNFPPSISNSNNDDNLIKQIKEACEKWGFFQVINHGVSQERRERVELAAREFFALPLEEKKRVRRDEKNPLGYYDSEHTKNVRDWKEVFDFTVKEPTLVPASHEIGDAEIMHLINQWPDFPSGFREACQDYAQEMLKLSFKLLELIAVSLGLPPGRLSGFFDDHASFVRVNYYAPCPSPDLVLGVGPHKDSGALTVLAQDGVGGLQVKRKSDGQWILVEPIPDAYIINVGDVIQVWSNDKYESVEHRVRVNYDKDRLSIPFFFNPSHYVTVSPLAELVDERNPTKYTEYNYGKFYTTRRLSDFKKLKAENIQIHHFKTVD